MFCYVRHLLKLTTFFATTPRSLGQSWDYHWRNVNMYNSAEGSRWSTYNRYFNKRKQKSRVHVSWLNCCITCLFKCVIISQIKFMWQKSLSKHTFHNERKTYVLHCKVLQWSIRVIHYKLKVTFMLCCLLFTVIVCRTVAGPCLNLNLKMAFLGMQISIIKVRWWDRVHFKMGIPILVRRHLYLYWDGLLVQRVKLSMIQYLV